MENSKDFNELIARIYAVTNEKVLGFIAQRVNDMRMQKTWHRMYGSVSLNAERQSMRKR